MLFYFLHNYFKYKNDLQYTACFFNHIFRGDNPQLGGVLSPPTPPGFPPMGRYVPFIN